MGEFETKYYETANSDMERAQKKDWKIKKTVDFLSANLGHGNKVLEIGCGLAGLADVLSKEIFYFGADVSKYAVSEAAKRAGDSRNAKFFEARAEGLPFGDNEFDAAVSMFVLEHLDKPKEALLEMARVLKAGGFLILIAPNLELPFSYPSALRHKSKLFRIKFLFVRLFDYFKRIMGGYNFRIIDENYLQATGRYVKKDDDLVYLVSSQEVIKFLEKLNFEFIFINKTKKWINRFPAMKYYGTELFVIAKKL